MDTLEFYLHTGGSISTEEEEGYAVKISMSRVRDAVTGRERLLAALYDGKNGNEAYACVSCSLIDLQRDLFGLREYGVMISRKNVMHMAMEIEKKYSQIICKIDNSTQTVDSCIREILSFICQHIRDNGVEVKTVGVNDLYCIPVMSFRELFKNSPYSGFTLREIRRKLRDLGYTYCTVGRSDYTISEGEDTYKVIAVIADEPDIVDIMQDLSEKSERMHGK